MFKTCVALLLICFFFFRAEAQIDKKQKSSNSVRIKSKISNNTDPELLIKKALDNRTKNPSKAISYIEEAIIMSKAQKNTSTEAKAYELLGDINQDIEQWTDAIEHYNKTINLLSKNDRTKQHLVQSKIGNCYKETSQYNKAIEAYKKSLSFSQNNNEKFNTKTAIGDIHYLQSNILLAQEQYKEALKLAETNKNTSQISIAKANLAKTYAKQKNNQEAEQLLEESEEALSKIEKDVSDYNYSVVTEAQDEVIQQYDDEKEIEVRSQNTLPSSEKANKYTVKQNQKLAEALINTGDVDKAITTLNNTISLADRSQLTTEKATAQKTLSNAFSEKGDYKEALDQYKAYIATKEAELIEKEKLLEQRKQIVKRQRGISSISSDFELYETEEHLLQEQNRRQQWIILSLAVLLLISAISALLIYRNAKAKRKANQLLALKSLRSQMNPHFIFNALNSVNNFISKNDERSANKFLSEFSKLMRMVLENSQKELIPLQDEIELISLYLKLEHFRFRDKFDYHLNIDENLRETTIPPMLIQPFIENAVWHGLRYKKSFGRLEVSLHQEKNHICVTIKDDGIGRVRSQEIKTENQQQKSQGLKNTKERISLINKVYKKKYKLNITDVDAEKDDVGTFVELKL